MSLFILFLSLSLSRARAVVLVALLATVPSCFAIYQETPKLTSGRFSDGFTSPSIFSIFCQNRQHSAVHVTAGEFCYFARYVCVRLRLPGNVLQVSLTLEVAVSTPDDEQAT